MDKLDSRTYKSAVTEKLGIIEGLYPAERLERSKERWRRLWNGEPKADRLPFIYSPVSAPYWELIPKEDLLMMYLDDFILRGKFGDDFIPGYFHSFHQGSLSTLFGAEAFEVENDGVLDTNSVQIMDTVEDAKNLEPPRFTGETWPERTFSEDGWCADVTDGRLPLHAMGFGPFETAAKLWGHENLMCAALEAPELYDRVMGYVTDASMMVYERQRELFGDMLIETCLNPHDWVETGKSVSVGMDSMVMMSEAFFDGFCAPYYKRIADEYAPITIHACGWFRQLVPYLCRSPLFNGLHTGQMTLAELVEAGCDDGVVYIPPGVNVKNLGSHINLLKENGLRACMTVGGLWAEGPASSWTDADWDRMRRTHEEKVINLLI